VEQNRRLPASTYRIRVQKKDYETYENLIRLTAGQNRSLYVVLQRSKSVVKEPVQPAVEEEKRSNKVWLFVAGGGAVAAGAAAYFLLSGSPDNGGNGPDETPGIPDPIFPGSD
ncbi:MAG: PEGA domain-containing protein, partial [Calditrichota bacterium]